MQSCQTESVLAPDKQTVAVVFKAGCPQITQAKINFLVKGVPTYPSIRVDREAFNLSQRWGRSPDAFSNTLGLPKSMRKFTLLEWLAVSGLNEWVAPVEPASGRPLPGASRVLARLVTVKDDATVLCPGADAIGCFSPMTQANNFAESLNPGAQVPRCPGPTCSGPWSEVFDRYWILDRGVLVTPTSAGFGINLDPRRVRTTLKGVTGLRLTVEFDGGRIATIDLP